MSRLRKDLGALERSSRALRNFVEGSAREAQAKSEAHLRSPAGEAARQAHNARVTADLRSRLTVKPTRIIGTDTVVFSAWEPRAGHSTIMTIAGRNMGRVGTRALPPALEALPGVRRGVPGSGLDRQQRVRAFHDAQYEEAYRAILAAYPSAREGDRSMGEISLTNKVIADRIAPGRGGRA